MDFEASYDENDVVLFWQGKSELDCSNHHEKERRRRKKKEKNNEKEEKR